MSTDTDGEGKGRGVQEQGKLPFEKENDRTGSTEGGALGLSGGIGERVWPTFHHHPREGSLIISAQNIRIQYKLPVSSFKR